MFIASLFAELRNVMHPKATLFLLICELHAPLWSPEKTATPSEYQPEVLNLWWISKNFLGVKKTPQKLLFCRWIFLRLNAAS